MYRNRFLRLGAALICVVGLAPGVAAAEVDCDSVYCFSPADFGEELTGICITGLPDSGTMLLGHRVVQVGDILTADQVAQMTFSPLRTETDASAGISYLPVFGNYVEEPAVMTIGIRGKVDQAPIAEDSAAETYKNLPATGTLKVTDPEGEPMTYTVTRQPKRGSVTIDANGSFTYTPKKNKIGVDSFVYTATDPAGKVSREATVTVTILKPSDAAQYTDTVGRDCRFEAEWMRHTGIFTGETVAENPCFSPDREVTHGEFVTMLVKALEIPSEEALTAVCNDDTPQWLKPYLAAAIRSGLTAGVETHDANDPITQADAHTMLRNALHQDTLEVFGEDNGLPLTRGTAAQLLYRAAQMAADSGKSDTF